jgi:hypothetical protein
LPLRRRTILDTSFLIAPEEDRAFPGDSGKKLHGRRMRLVGRGDDLRISARQVMGEFPPAVVGYLSYHADRSVRNAALMGFRSDAGASSNVIRPDGPQ